MRKVSSNSRQVKSIRKEDLSSAVASEEELMGLDARIELIQALIPLGLQAVEEELQKEGYDGYVRLFETSKAAK